MFKDIPTDVMQLIVNCLDANGFYAFIKAFKNICDVSIDEYIKNRRGYGTLPIDGNHKMTQEYIDRGLVEYKDTMSYAGAYDLPHYMHIKYVTDDYDGISPMIWASCCTSVCYLFLHIIIYIRIFLYKCIYT